MYQKYLLSFTPIASIFPTMLAVNPTLENNPLDEIPSIFEEYQSEGPDYYQENYPVTISVENENVPQDVAQLDSVPQETTTKPKIPTNMSLREQIVNTARQHVGGKYVWGGNGIKGGKGHFDCSGLIYYAYTQNGFDRKKMPRQSNSFEHHGKKISLKDALPGDIIHTKGHVKMVSKIENGTIWVVEAAGRKKGIVERPLTNTKNIISVRNYVDYLNNGGKLIPKLKYVFR